jgi:hypothetical protein
MTRVVRLEDYERRLEERKKALGYTGNDFVMPNSGISRTPEKRALLKELADMARASGREPPFKANF